MKVKRVPMILVIWYDPKKKVYFHKINKGTYKRYKVGDTNSYGHQVFYVVDDLTLAVYKYPISLRRSLKHFLCFLEDKL